MKYHTPAAFRQALEEHLKQQERKTGEPLVRLRKRVAFERFMARLQEKKNSENLTGRSSTQTPRGRLSFQPRLFRLYSP